MGQIGDPAAELTKLRWFLMNPGKESNYSNVLLKQLQLTFIKNFIALM